MCRDSGEYMDVAGGDTEYLTVIPSYSPVFPARRASIASAVDLDELKQQLRSSLRPFEDSSVRIIRHLVRSYYSDLDDYILHAVAAAEILQRFIDGVLIDDDTLVKANEVYQRFILDDNIPSKVNTIQQLAESALDKLEKHKETGRSLNSNHFQLLKKLMTSFVAENVKHDEVVETTYFTQRMASVIQWFDKEGVISVPDQGGFLRPSNYWLPTTLGFANFTDFAVSDHPVLLQNLNRDVYHNPFSDKKDKLLIAKAICVRIARQVFSFPLDRLLLFTLLEEFVKELNFYDLVVGQQWDNDEPIGQQVITQILLNAALFSQYKIVKLACKFHQDDLEAAQRKDEKYIENRLKNGNIIEKKCIIAILTYHHPLTLVEEKLKNSIDQKGHFDPVVMRVEEELERANYSPHVFELEIFDGLLTHDVYQHASVIGRQMLVRCALFRLEQARHGANHYNEEQVKNSINCVLKSDDLNNTPFIVELLSWFEGGRVVNYSNDWLTSSNLLTRASRVIKTEFLGDADAFFRSQHPLLKAYLFYSNPSAEELPWLKRMARVRIQHYLALCLQGRVTEADQWCSGEELTRCMALCEGKFDAAGSEELNSHYQFDPLPMDFYVLQKKYDQPTSYFCIHHPHISEELTYARYQGGSPNARRTLMHIALNRLYYIAFVSDPFTLQQRSDYLNIVWDYLSTNPTQDLRHEEIKKFLRNFQYEEGRAYAEAKFDDTYSCALELAVLKGIPVIDALNKIMSQVGQSNLAHASPRVRELLIGGSSLRAALDRLEEYVTGYYRRLMQSKVWPIDYPIPDNIGMLMDSARQYCAWVKDDEKEQDRFNRVFSQLLKNGHYDDQFIIYQQAILDRFNRKRDDHIVTTWRWDLTGKFVKYPNRIDKFLTLGNYQEGGYQTRVLILQGCLNLVRADQSKADLYRPIFDEAKQDEWLDWFPEAVREGIDAIGSNSDRARVSTARSSFFSKHRLSNSEMSIYLGDEQKLGDHEDVVAAKVAI